MKDYLVFKVTDETGADKMDQPARIGRVVRIDTDNIKCGYNLFVECVYPSFWKSFITSRVKQWDPIDGGIKLTTENSIYYFKEKTI